MWWAIGGVCLVILVVWLFGRMAKFGRDGFDKG
jgi:hypothetical protein